MNRSEVEPQPKVTLLEHVSMFGGLALFGVGLAIGQESPGSGVIAMVTGVGIAAIGNRRHLN